MLRNQESEFLKAFSYWPIPTAREGNNIYDVRSYELKPGSMYDWGNYWSKGINCRKNVRDDIPYVCLFPKYLILSTYSSTSILKFKFKSKYYFSICRLVSSLNWEDYTLFIIFGKIKLWLIFFAMSLKFGCMLFYYKLLY